LANLLSSASDPTRERKLQLLLVDSDPIFRTGLRSWLEQAPDLQVVGDVATGEAALQFLADQEQPLDAVVLDLALGLRGNTALSGLTLCREITTQFPGLSILLLSAPQPAPLVEVAFQLGVAGFYPKGVPPATVLAAVRQVAKNQPLPQGGQWGRASVKAKSGLVALGMNLTNLRLQLRLSGLQQIEMALMALNAQQDETMMWDRLFLDGRQRELRAARWVVRQILPLPGSPIAAEIVSPPVPSTGSASGEEGILEPQEADQFALLCDRTLTKIEAGLKNLTTVPLEIDILRDERKQELLVLILRNLESLVQELRLAQVGPEQLQEKQADLLRDLWATSITEFFGRYYTLAIDRDRPVEVIPVLIQEAGAVQRTILNQIPLVNQWFEHLLFEIPLAIDNQTYEMGSSQAMVQAEVLLHNLIIQVANAVVQPLLNHFADIEAVKQRFYHRRLLSTRNIEQFRNELSWKYRLEAWIGKPTAIFESRYRLWTLADQGTKTISIYAPRRTELVELSGLQLAVTLTLEVRDAIAPRFRSLVSFLGRGLVYLLTRIVGRGIGLIGRGILEGIGSSWRERAWSWNQLGRK